MIGSPGEGKTTLAKMLPTILPLLSDDEFKELQQVYLSKGLRKNDKYRPFEAIHHTTTIASLLGSYNSQLKTISPGLVSLASYGVLFLDEFTEFTRDQLEALRQPITDTHITVNRSQGSKVFPCQFQLVAACNPCKCGYYGTKHCTCSDASIKRYLSKISGPILDRIDLFATVYPITNEDRFKEPVKNQSRQFYLKVIRARLNQYNRYGDNITNGSLVGLNTLHEVKLSKKGLDWFKEYLDNQHPISTRRIISIAKISRTIADIVGSNTVETNHLKYSLQFVTNPLDIKE